MSLSKWESGASLPDLDRVIRLADLFGVTTDYLLRDEPMPEPTPVDHSAADSPDMRHVGDDEARTYLALIEEEAPRFAHGVMLCVLSPIPLIAIAGLLPHIPARYEEALPCIGVAILLLMVAFAVRIFITGNIRLSPYEYLEKELLHISPAIKSETEARQTAQQPEYSAGMIRGVTLCIVSAIPLLAGGFGLGDSIGVWAVCLLLALVAIAVRTFVRVGLVRESYSKLLQTGDYTAESKRRAPIAGIYWCAATALYLAISFITMAWDRTWILWPVAGVLFGCVAAAQQVLAKRR